MQKTKLKLLPYLLSSSNDGYPDFSQNTVSNFLGQIDWNNNARFVHKQNQWYLWNNICWKKDDIQQSISKVRIYLDKIVIELFIWESGIDYLKEKEKDALIKKVSSSAKILRSKKYISEINQLIQSNTATAVKYDIFDNNPFVLGLPNGMVNLRSGQVTSSKRSEYITKSTKISPLKIKPKLWIKFLNKIFNNNKSLIDFMQVLCGYCLTGSTQEQKLFFLFGAGANGKSVFLEILYYILNDYAKHAPSSLFISQKNQGHPTEIAGLNGMRCIIGSEIPADKEWNEAIIKDLTGGEVITARLMRQDFFDFIPQFTLLISGNFKPKMNVLDYAIIRRIVLIPFNVTIPVKNRDNNLINKLKQEAPEILQWMIDGSVKYCKSGLKVPPLIQSATDDYIQDQDVVAEFIKNNLKEDISGKVLFSEIYSSFLDWSIKKQLNYSEREFRKILKDKNFIITRSNSKYFITGWTLKMEYKNENH